MDETAEPAMSTFRVRKEEKKSLEWAKKINEEDRKKALVRAKTDGNKKFKQLLRNITHPSITAGPKPRRGNIPADRPGTPGRGNIPAGMMEITVRGRVGNGAVTTILPQNTTVKALAVNISSVMTVGINESDWGYKLKRGSRRPAGWKKTMKTIEQPKGSQKATLWVWDENYGAVFWVEDL